MILKLPSTLAITCKRHIYNNWHFIAVDFSQAQARKVLERDCKNIYCNAKQKKYEVITR